MIKVKITTGPENSFENISRQLNRNTRIWNTCIFYINEHIEECDWWIICHPSSLKIIESTKCARENIVFISMENKENLEVITNHFLNQFGKLITTDREVQHKCKVYKTGHTWWVGWQVEIINKQHKISKEYRFDLDDLVKMPPMSKNKFISVIISNKNTMTGHQKRNEFIQKLLLTEVGQFIDCYGDGYIKVIDKWEALKDYRYHICIENDELNDYWTEKLADPFLAYSVPIYFGCPNINEYFDAESIIQIDLNNVKDAVSKIKNLLKIDEYEKRLPLVINSRKKVLYEYNIFQLIEDVCNHKLKKYEKATIYPNWYFKRDKLFILKMTYSMVTRLINFIKRCF